MPQVENDIVARAVACKLLSDRQVEECRAMLPPNAGSEAVVAGLVEAGLLTKWHVQMLGAAKTRGFFVSHYKLLEPLGAGGMGQVFRALDLDVCDRQVAVKILTPQTATLTTVTRFRREGTAALQLQHEHMVRCFELGQHGELHFLVMELVEGPTLKQYISRSGRLSVEETARIGYEVALALEHARQQQIVHRDVKPSNILLTRERHVKLTDLGLVRFFGPQGEAETLNTRTGMLLGTMDYLAPEQAEDAKRADTRSDIYSLGCTLYECLTGEPPFARGTEVQKIIAHRQTRPPPIAERNPAVDNLFADIIEKRMLAKLPDDRYDTPAEVAEVLEPWLKSAARGFDLLDTLADIVQKDSALARTRNAPMQHLPRKKAPHAMASVNGGRAAARPKQLPKPALPRTALRNVLIALAVVAVLLPLGWRYSQRGAATFVPDPDLVPAQLPQADSDNSAEPAREGDVVTEPNSAAIAALAESSGGVVFLRALVPEQAAVLDGNLQRLSQPFSVAGVKTERGLFTHPPHAGAPALVSYSIGRQFRRFVGEVGLADSTIGRSFSPLTFLVRGDGRTLFRSREVQSKADKQTFDVDVTGIGKLELEVNCPGSNGQACAVWINPKLMREVHTPAQ